jgi:hypothetical protein|tara:strand:+ start:129 stop:497 length:369 start_codon:yes stop_codon:yes gene_type:complete
MERRFLIYDGFANDAESIFGPVIEKFNMSINSISDYGIIIENKRVLLEISYETSLQIWLQEKQYNIMEMLPKLSMFKGNYTQFKNALKTYDTNRLESLKTLANFLAENFTEELSEIRFEDGI